MCGKHVNPVIIETVDLETFEVSELFTAADSQTLANNVMAPRYNAGDLVYTNDNKIWLFGGKTEKDVDEKLYYFDLDSMTFTCGVIYEGERIGARVGHRCVVSPSGAIIIAFGKFNDKFVHTINTLVRSGENNTYTNTKVSLLNQIENQVYPDIRDG